MENKNNISRTVLMVIGIIIFVSFLAVLSSYINSVIEPTTGSDQDNNINFTETTHIIPKTNKTLIFDIDLFHKAEITHSNKFLE